MEPGNVPGSNKVKKMQEGMYYDQEISNIIANYLSLNTGREQTIEQIKDMRIRYFNDRDIEKLVDNSFAFILKDDGRKKTAIVFINSKPFN
jgi:hypothetical protein